MGHLGKVDAPAVQATIKQGLAAITGAGKAAGILNFNEAGAKAQFDQGFHFIAVSGDATMLAREGTRVVKTFAAG